MNNIPHNSVNSNHRKSQLFGNSYTGNFQSLDKTVLSDVALCSSEKYNKETVHPGVKYFSTNPVAYTCKNIIRDVFGISLKIDPQTGSAFN